MTTNLAIKGNLVEAQLDVVLNLLKSWNLEAEIFVSQKAKARHSSVQRAKGILKKYANVALQEQKKTLGHNRK